MSSDENSKVRREPRAPGRPSTYDDSYAERLLDVLKQGYTRQEAAAALEISRDTLYRWAKEHEAFGEALKVGIEWSEAANISVLRQGALGKINKFNPTAYALYMNNCFGWSNKDNQSPQGNVININGNMNVLNSMSTKELDDKLAGYMTKFGATSLEDLRGQLLSSDSSSDEGSDNE